MNSKISQAAKILRDAKIKIWATELTAAFFVAKKCYNLSKELKL